MKQGINETKDILGFITALGVLIGKEVSGDGLQLTDLLKLFDDQDFRSKVSDAYQGVMLVPAELRDLSVSEGFDLSLAAIESFRKVLESFEMADVA
ncbi:hypothetical protein [Pseudobacteriovorax antillogorgiicola]|uniref:Uncharacterized protein n=1 Tax=Pseudobacteriovorax antillogorgiicola TaxID=1513793 RepID=A0A1Y6C3E2_9BACT|nr:hypothetical protein [Pseudobacteriovorax antillogorgiicola]TCS43380.1 hypothetical protein EDD56_13720 [Pseudobacteriovorax antillogorgiicola]SMF34977.1 hypothetical protein SAMN06296036_110188 [Pseudobacteriovorax antillogorgiicola]